MYFSGLTFHGGMAEFGTEIPGTGKFSGISAMIRSNPECLHFSLETCRDQSAPTWKANELIKLEKCCTIIPTDISDEI